MSLERILALFLAITLFGFIEHRNVFQKGCTTQNDRQKGKYGDSHIN